MSNFRRRLFFWIERLNITRGERRFVVTAIVVSLIVWLTDFMIKPGRLYGPDYYRPLDSLYQQYVSQIHLRDSLIHRYYYTEADDSENIASGVPFAIPGDVPISGKEKEAKKSRPDNHSININHADSLALISLPGIGPIIAGKIIDYRNDHGPFPDPNSLKKVKGIGDKKLEQILPYLTLTNTARNR